MYFLTTHYKFNLNTDQYQLDTIVVPLQHRNKY